MRTNEKKGKHCPLKLRKIFNTIEIKIRLFINSRVEDYFSPKF